MRFSFLVSSAHLRSAVSANVTTNKLFLLTNSRRSTPSGQDSIPGRCPRCGALPCNRPGLSEARWELSESAADERSVCSACSETDNYWVCLCLSCCYHCWAGSSSAVWISAFVSLSSCDDLQTREAAILPPPGPEGVCVCVRVCVCVCLIALPETAWSYKYIITYQLSLSYRWLWVSALQLPSDWIYWD